MRSYKKQFIFKDQSVRPTAFFDMSIKKIVEMSEEMSEDAFVTHMNREMMFRPSYYGRKVEDRNTHNWARFSRPVNASNRKEWIWLTYMLERANASGTIEFPSEVLIPDWSKEERKGMIRVVSKGKFDFIRAVKMTPHDTRHGGSPLVFQLATNEGYFLPANRTELDAFSEALNEDLDVMLEGMPNFDVSRQFALGKLNLNKVRAESNVVWFGKASEGHHAWSADLYTVYREYVLFSEMKKRLKR